MADSQDTRIPSAVPNRFAPDIRALANEIGDLINAYSALDEVRPRERQGLRQIKIEDAENAVLDRRRLLESLAHMNTAECSLGAVLQLGIMVDVFDDTIGCIGRPFGRGPSTEEVRILERRFNGLALHLLAYITRLAPELREGPIAQTYFNPHPGRDPIDAARDALNEPVAA